jgi:hypothetical protein
LIRFALLLSEAWGTIDAAERRPMHAKVTRGLLARRGNLRGGNFRNLARSRMGGRGSEIVSLG